jgi:hypothetical protein
VALSRNDKYNPCIDVHWMQYHDSSCTFDMLDDMDAFTIERHGLRISQPFEQLDDGTYRIACRVSGVGGRTGKIDFSRFTSEWWNLAHTEIHVPSEHTQNGKRYDAEIEMAHFYAVATQGDGDGDHTREVRVPGLL